MTDKKTFWENNFYSIFLTETERNLATVNLSNSTSTFVQFIQICNFYIFSQITNNPTTLYTSKTHFRYQSLCYGNRLLRKINPERENNVNDENIHMWLMSTFTTGNHFLVFISLQSVILTTLVNLACIAVVDI